MCIGHFLPCVKTSTLRRLTLVRCSLFLGLFLFLYFVMFSVFPLFNSVFITRNIWNPNVFFSWPQTPVQPAGSAKLRVGFECRKTCYFFIFFPVCAFELLRVIVLDMVSVKLIPTFSPINLYFPHRWAIAVRKKKCLTFVFMDHLRYEETMS